MNRMQKTDGPVDLRDLPSTGETHASLRLSKIGPYRLGRAVGRGKTGITYEAVHVEQGRKVALKILDKRALNDSPISRQDALFAREAMILAKLPRHPGVIGVLDAGQAHNLPYLVTEYVDGQPFSEEIRLRRPDFRILARIIRDVALAVHHAHENGILHRNLKPGNILVDASSRAYVTDFGSAKRMGPEGGQSSHLFQGGIVGSPSYMSPEQAAGTKELDRRADVYSLGAMLYEILTGRPPFIGGSTVRDLVSVIRAPIVAPSDVSPEWAAWSGDKSIETLCMGALSKSPEGRPATAKALADALSLWLGEKPGKEPSRRPSWLWSMIVGGVATMAAVVALVRGSSP
ncbi:MAG TPA: serine/threonine-protein kinase [Candidatus Binatia bacterium]|nr:serine/threonine-protein kinase [Candidatus Binatia bacterium]